MRHFIFSAAIIIQIIIAITENGMTRSLAELTAFALICLSFPLFPRRESPEKDRCQRS
ncbi:hypothetical protein [Vibrio quintilis]|uniref:hypothetical protein n=1 Tax=Vibrio quintilis TaxID=1117707 RepID=UPI00190EC3D5|nr:hypothetical protein [Vibrio quintilis]